MGYRPCGATNKFVYSSLRNYLVTLPSISQRSPFTLISTQSIESVYREECEHFCRSGWRGAGGRSILTQTRINIICHYSSGATSTGTTFSAVFAERSRVLLSHITPRLCLSFSYHPSLTSLPAGRSAPDSSKVCWLQGQK